MAVDEPDAEFQEKELVFVRGYFTRALFFSTLIGATAKADAVQLSLKVNRLIDQMIDGSLTPNGTEQEPPLSALIDTAWDVLLELQGIVIDLEPGRVENLMRRWNRSVDTKAVPAAITQSTRSDSAGSNLDRPNTDATPIAIDDEDIQIVAGPSGPPTKTKAVTPSKRVRTEEHGWSVPRKQLEDEIDRLQKLLTTERNKPSSAVDSKEGRKATKSLKRKVKALEEQLAKQESQMKASAKRVGEAEVARGTLERELTASKAEVQALAAEKDHWEEAKRELEERHVVVEKARDDGESERTKLEDGSRKMLQDLQAALRLNSNLAKAMKESQVIQRDLTGVLATDEESTAKIVAELKEDKATWTRLETEMQEKLAAAEQREVALKTDLAKEKTATSALTKQYEGTARKLADLSATSGTREAEQKNAHQQLQEQLKDAEAIKLTFERQMDELKAARQNSQKKLGILQSDNQQRQKQYDIVVQTNQKLQSQLDSAVQKVDTMVKARETLGVPDSGDTGATSTLVAGPSTSMLQQQQGELYRMKVKVEFAEQKVAKLEEQLRQAGVVSGMKEDANKEEVQKRVRAEHDLDAEKAKLELVGQELNMLRVEFGAIRTAHGTLCEQLSFHGLLRLNAEGVYVLVLNTPGPSQPPQQLSSHQYHPQQNQLRNADPSSDPKRSSGNPLATIAPFQIPPPPAHAQANRPPSQTQNRHSTASESPRQPPHHSAGSAHEESAQDHLRTAAHYAATHYAAQGGREPSQQGQGNHQQLLAKQGVAMQQSHERYAYHHQSPSKRQGSAPQPNSAALDQHFHIHDSTMSSSANGGPGPSTMQNRPARPTWSTAPPAQPPAAQQSVDNDMSPPLRSIHDTFPPTPVTPLPLGHPSQHQQQSQHRQQSQRQPPQQLQQPQSGEQAQPLSAERLSYLLYAAAQLPLEVNLNAPKQVLYNFFGEKLAVQCLDNYTKMQDPDHQGMSQVELIQWMMMMAIPTPNQTSASQPPLSTAPQTTLNRPTPQGHHLDTGPAINATPASPEDTKDGILANCATI